MWIWIAAALAGQIVVDAKVPVAVMLDGEMVAQLWRAAVVTVPAEPGPHALTVVLDGNPRRFDVTITDGAPVVVLAGRSGVSLGAAEDVAKHVPTAPPDGAPTEVRFRVADGAYLMVQVGRQRVVVGPGDGMAIPLPLGDHPFSVRSSDGTAVFARGVLTVSASAEPRVVQLSEGALPETSGQGVAFHPDRT